MNKIVEIYTDISLNNFDKNTKSFGISHFVIDQFENEIKFRQNVKFADIKLIKDNERFDTSVLEAYAIYIAF